MYYRVQKLPRVRGGFYTGAGHNFPLPYAPIIRSIVRSTSWSQNIIKDLMRKYHSLAPARCYDILAVFTSLSTCMALVLMPDFSFEGHSAWNGLTCYRQSSCLTCSLLIPSLSLNVTFAGASAL